MNPDNPSILVGQLELQKSSLTPRTEEDLWTGGDAPPVQAYWRRALLWGLVVVGVTRWESETEGELYSGSILLNGVSPVFSTKSADFDEVAGQLEAQLKQVIEEFTTCVAPAPEPEDA